MKSSLLRLLLVLIALPAFNPHQLSAAEVRDTDTVTSTVQDVLSDPEYRHLKTDEDVSRDRTDLPEWLTDFLDWLFESDSSSSSSESSMNLGWLFNVLLWGVLIAAVIVVGMSIRHWTSGLDTARPFDDVDDQEAINPSRPAGDIPVNEYRRRALAAAESGDYRTAIRELVLGSMSWTERVGLIRHRRGLTNRDYIRAIWRQVDRRESLLQIVAAFERVFYGHRSADLLMYEACLAEFQKSFLSEATDAQPTT